MKSPTQPWAQISWAWKN